MVFSHGVINRDVPAGTALLFVFHERPPTTGTVGLRDARLFFRHDHVTVADHEPLAGYDCELGAAPWTGGAWESPTLAAVEQVYPDFLRKGWLLPRAMPWTDFLAVVRSCTTP